jgi:hypothetical protein
MTRDSRLLAFATMAALAFHPRSDAAEAPLPKASLRIQSARVNRASQELNKRFAGRYSNDGNTGVSLQLALTLEEGTLLPLQREAVTLETFVDDTYQNLQSAAGEALYYDGNNQPSLADDGRTLLFSVSTRKSPA